MCRNEAFEKDSVYPIRGVEMRINYIPFNGSEDIKRISTSVMSVGNIPDESLTFTLGLVSRMSQGLNGVRKKEWFFLS